MRALLLGISCSLTFPLFAAPTLNLVADGFERPVDLTATDHLPDFIYVVEQHGEISAVKRQTGENLGVVLDISERVTRDNNEQGLLGLTFSPNFAKDGRIYVNYTATGSPTMTRISRFTLSPDGLTGDAKEEEILYEFEQDFGNHNGGWVAFGPDGYLYISAGDGGSGYDPKQRAQDLTNPLGSLLRIDVSGEHGYTVPDDNPFKGQTGAVPEIYAYGLRNAWRCAFDSANGDLWIADVGQNKFEEINYLPKGEALGKNFGWRLREGFHETPDSRGQEVGGPAPAGAVEPIYEYGHGGGTNEGLSITGGYVYRGPNADLQGEYFFADYASQRIWSIKAKDGKASDFKDYTDALKPQTGQIGPISSFGEDAERNLYILSHTGGQVYRVD